MSDFSASAIAKWCDPAQEPILSKPDATTALHNLGSRSRFIRSLPQGAALLDVGAGEGSTIIFRQWPGPARPDLKFYAWAGEKGGYFDQFDGHEVGYWPQDPPDFEGRRFDAIFSANFLEHIPDPVEFVRWAVSRLSPGGAIYLEWPRPESYDLPTRDALAAVGVPVMAGRYHDDETHLPTTPDVEAVIAALTAAGLALTETGVASVPFIDRQLAIHARRDNDLVSMTLAYWSHTGWCRYLVARST